MVFEQSTSLKEYPILLFFRKNETFQAAPIQAAFTVSKKNFKRAVDRNRIKRLMREAYRRNKYPVYQAIDQEQFQLVFVYIGKKIDSYAQIEQQIQSLLRKLVTL